MASPKYKPERKGRGFPAVDAGVTYPTFKSRWPGAGAAGAAVPEVGTAAGTHLENPRVRPAGRDLLMAELPNSNWARACSACPMTHQLAER